jgi:hypothetical protein
MLPVRAEAALRRMAADYDGVSPAEALEDLLAFVLAEDAAIARRTLHVVRKQEGVKARARRFGFPALSPNCPPAASPPVARSH